MNVGRALSHYVGLQRSAPIVERRWERPALIGRMDWHLSIAVID